MNKAMTPLYGLSGTLTRAEDVEEPQDDRFQSEAGGEGLAVELAGELGRGIRRQGPQRIGLGLHFPRRDAVGASAAGVDEAAHSGLAGRLEHLQSAGGANAMTAERVFDAVLHRCPRRQMEDDTDTLDRAGRRCAVGNVPFHDLGSGVHRREVLAVAGVEVVQHAHPAAPSREGFDQMTADKAGAAGHEAQVAHEVTP